MSVDVQTEVEIERPRDEVAGYAADPANATAWYANIESAELKTAPPLAVGSRIGFVAASSAAAWPTPTKSGSTLRANG